MNLGAENRKKWCAPLRSFPGNKPEMEFTFDRPVKVASLVLTSANDCPPRDPKHFTLFGGGDQVGYPMYQADALSAQDHAQVAAEQAAAASKKAAEDAAKAAVKAAEAAAKASKKAAEDAARATAKAAEAAAKKAADAAAWSAKQAAKLKFW